MLKLFYSTSSAGGFFSPSAHNKNGWFPPHDGFQPFSYLSIT